MTKLKKWMIIPAILLVVLLFLTASNPNKEDFFTYSKKLVKRMHEPPKNKFEQFIISIADETRIAALRIGTKRINYVFFSVFQIPDDSKPNGRKILGLGRSIFIPLN